MARRGRKRRLEPETEYWRRLASGVGSVEVFRQLGIGRKTGDRWWAENGGLQPDRLPEASRPGGYLSLSEHRRIASLRGHGLGIREMAGLLGRAPSTVSRELRGNSRPHDYGRYAPTRPTTAAANAPDVPDVPSCPRTSSSRPQSAAQSRRRQPHDALSDLWAGSAAPRTRGDGPPSWFQRSCKRTAGLRARHDCSPLSNG
ncbi:helix-turn-helix domain-containing protein [Streptomyces marokkonensis]|uniref:Helix-turn-helix domain-containing protein n=1 Tax=Streptomyces marokkonensis TaxID=324855 RepID=A0ABW6QFV6_9ACTN